MSASARAAFTGALQVFIALQHDGLPEPEVRIDVTLGAGPQLLAVDAAAAVGICSGAGQAGGPCQGCHAAARRGKRHLRIRRCSHVQHIGPGGHGLEIAGHLVGGFTTLIGVSDGRVAFDFFRIELGDSAVLVAGLQVLCGCAAREARVIHHHHLAGLGPQAGQGILHLEVGVQVGAACHQGLGTAGSADALDLVAMAGVIDEDLVAILDARRQAVELTGDRGPGQLHIGHFLDVARRHAHGHGDLARILGIQVDAGQVQSRAAIVANPQDEAVVLGLGQAVGRQTGNKGGRSGSATQDDWRELHRNSFRLCSTLVQGSVGPAVRRGSLSGGSDADFKPVSDAHSKQLEAPRAWPQVQGRKTVWLP
jgi:hypothetical protein